MIKRLLRQAWAQEGLARMVAAYLRLVARTARIEFEGPTPKSLWIEPGGPFIYCFWHGRLALMPAGWPGLEDVHVLISSHGDGRLIARAVERLGFRTVAGSSRRGATPATRQLFGRLREGASIAVTPDGPRGPRMRAQAGAAALSIATGAPVVAASAAARPSLVLGSWDRFMLPLPFARIRFHVHPPAHAHADESAQDFAARLENLLNEATRGADRALGLRPVEPAPPRRVTKAP